MTRILLSARGLAVGYPGRTVLKGVDLDLRSGEVFAFIGPNGAGKTTLFRALSGAIAPLAGQVFVAGRGHDEGAAAGTSWAGAGRVAGSGLPEGAAAGPEMPHIPLRSLSRRARAGMIARVLQGEDPVWPLPVRDYVEAGSFASTGWLGTAGPKERLAIEQALESMDLSGLAGRPVTELSGGEFRRVVIARALAQRTPVLLFDEPTADLDLERQMETLGLLRALAAEGKAVAFSVHDLNLAAIAADRVALVSGGKIAAVGTPREVITERMVASVYGAEVMVRVHPLADVPQLILTPGWLAGRASDDPHGDGTRVDGALHESPGAGA